MKRILLIEDHADIRRLVRMTLELEDYEVHEACDGASGLRLARSLRPELVLLDVMMPGDLDGLAVCRAIRSDRNCAHTQIILLSARGRSADCESGLQAGADEYIVKPFSPLQLIDKLAHRLNS